MSASSLSVSLSPAISSRSVVTLEKSSRYRNNIVSRSALLCAVVFRPVRISSSTRRFRSSSCRVEREFQFRERMAGGRRANGMERNARVGQSNGSPSRSTARAFYTLVPIRPRPRGERRSLRTFAVASPRPPLVERKRKKGYEKRSTTATRGRRATTKRNETKRNETKRNETKRNETTGLLTLTRSIASPRETHPVL